MDNYGFVRVASAIPTLKVADCFHNVEQMQHLIEKATAESVAIVCFPELSITGYTCNDLFFQKRLLENSEKALVKLMNDTEKLNIISIVGMPFQINGRLFNVAVVFSKNKVLGVVPKVNIPNNNEFYEKRWFHSGENIFQSITIANQEVTLSSKLLFETSSFRFGIEICEDLWSPIPPSSQLAIEGAELIFNLSASNELVGKQSYRKQLIKHQSASCHCGYIYTSAGYGESTTDMVFSGIGMVAENGSIVAENKRFSTQSELVITDIDVEKLQAERLRNSNFFNKKIGEYKTINLDYSFERLFTKKDDFKREIAPYPFIPTNEKRDESCQEIFSIQSLGLAKRWEHTKAKTLIIGVSGGLDSTLALLVCVKTADLLGYDRKRVIGVTMPGFGTTDRTYHNAVNLMKSLGITTQEISIRDASIQHFKDINHDINQHDVTYENVQARERTQILMDLANKEFGFVVGTGDLSEMALGWSTYNGDHMSMYAVNSSIPKTLVRYLVKWASSQFDASSQMILSDIVDTPISPELLPADDKGKIAQKTEEIIGSYELHDFFLYYFVRFGFTPEKIVFLAEKAFEKKQTKEEIQKVMKTFLRRFFSQQFKRSCVPDGPKVGSINLSPRSDWRMPSDAVAFTF